MVIYIVAAIVILIAAVINARKHNNDIKAMSLGLTGGISLAVAVLSAPYYALSYSDPFIICLKSIRYGAGSISLSIEPGIVSALELAEPLNTIYHILLYVLYLLGPVCASLFAVSFSRSVVEWIRFRGHRKIHVFSELNSRTVAIAESLAETRPKEMPVFCNDEEAGDEDLRMRARAAHSLFTRKNEADIPLKKNQNYEFYVINSDVRKVLTETAKLCDELIRKPEYDRTRVFVRYSASDSCLDLIRDLDRTYGSSVKLRPINEDSSEASCLLRNYTSQLSSAGDHSIIIVGGGDTGLSLLKNALCIMTGPESTFSVRFISKNAADEASRLKASSPGIMERPLSSYIGSASEGGEYDIRFYSADPEGSALYEILSAERKPDLVCVTGDDDEQNFSLAQRIKRFYAAQNSDLSYPPIACRVVDKKLNLILGSNDGIRLYGNEADRYGYESLIDPELEEEARRVHLSYMLPSMPNALDLEGDKKEKVLEDTGFYGYANMQSSMASALSLEFRRAYILSKKPEGDKRSDDEFIRSWLDDPQKLSILGDAEHMRWNAYQRVQGWRTADAAQTGAIAVSTSGKRIRSDEFMLHPALVSLEDLPEVEKTTDDIKHGVDPGSSGTGFVESDRVILRNLPLILGGR